MKYQSTLLGIVLFRNKYKLVCMTIFVLKRSAFHLLHITQVRKPRALETMTYKLRAYKKVDNMAVTKRYTAANW